MPNIAVPLKHEVAESAFDWHVFAHSFVLKITDSLEIIFVAKSAHKK